MNKLKIHKNELKVATKQKRSGFFILVKNGIFLSYRSQCARLFLLQLQNLHVIQIRLFPILNFRSIPLEMVFRQTENGPKMD